MAENPGVFIRSAQRVELVIEGCKALMNSINCAASSIKGLKPDVIYEGYRVYFSDDAVVASFLKQRFLPLSRERASIHSLTTKLVVRDVIPDSEDDFKQVLIEQLDTLRLRPVLGICSIPISPQYPDIQSGDWLVELDIPEIEDLDIFKNNGLPDKMSVSLISRSNATCHEKQVTYFCCICNDTDHSRQRCPHLENSSSSGDESRDSPQKSSTPSRSPPRFEIRDRTPKNASTSLISKSAKQHRIEAIASDLERKKTQLSTPKPLPEKREIKQEPAGELFSSPGLELPSLKRPLTESDSETSNKKFRFATIIENQRNEDTGVEASFAASSTTGRADSPCPIVVFDSSMPAFATNLMPRESTSQYDRANSFYEDNNVPNSNLPTSSQPETSFERSLHDMTSRDASDLSDSNDISRMTPRNTRKKPTYAPMVLPERIKQIVLSREKKKDELDVSQLEAFFNHVKKKMSPAKIAKQFSDDVNCVREQLKFIVQQYYMTPKAGSGEDSRFMKWLEGMLERFDYVPSKRKKAKSEPVD